MRLLRSGTASRDLVPNVSWSSGEAENDPRGCDDHNGLDGRRTDLVRRALPVADGRLCRLCKCDHRGYQRPPSQPNRWKLAGRGTFKALGAITDKGRALAYRTEKGDLITLRFVTIGKKGTITYGSRSTRSLQHPFGQSPPARRRTRVHAAEAPARERRLHHLLLDSDCRAEAEALPASARRTLRILAPDKRLDCVAERKSGEDIVDDGVGGRFPIGRTVVRCSATNSSRTPRCGTQVTVGRSRDGRLVSPLVATSRHRQR